MEQFSSVGNNFTGQLLLCIYQIVSRDFKRQYILDTEIPDEISSNGQLSETNENLVDLLPPVR